jgi:hypothetical protein
VRALAGETLTEQSIISAALNLPDDDGRAREAAR